MTRNAPHVNSAATHLCPSAPRALMSGHTGVLSQTTAYGPDRTTSFSCLCKCPNDSCQ